MDGIYALSTAPGRAGVAVVRVSGPEAPEALRALTGLPLPAPRTATLRTLRRAGDRAMIDRALCLYFPAPHSFTGEHVVEFQIHGSPAAVRRLLDALSETGLQPAAPGDFTRRAVLNGRMDLLQAEALGDVLHAESEAQLTAALEDYTGGLPAAVRTLREALYDLSALCEACLDFSDQEIGDDLPIRAEAEAIRARLQAMIEGAARRERLRSGYTVAIVGAPNVGKSSLLNALLERDAAIVSERAGTTRDAIEQLWSLHGRPTLLIDTAGLRETDDPIEAEGIRRARAKAEAADAVLWLADGSAPDSELVSVRPGTLQVYTKCDRSDFRAPPGAVCISARTGAGLEILRRELLQILENAAGAGGLTMLNNRHLSHLRAASRYVTAFCERPAPDPLPECGAEDLRLALRELDGLLGRHDIEHVLDRVFAGFCIGK